MHARDGAITVDDARALVGIPDRAMPAALRPLPDAPAFDTLEEAIGALYAAHGATPTPTQAARLSALTDVSSGTRDGLAILVGAAVVQAEAWRLAASSGGTGPLSFDVGLAVAARVYAAEAAQRAMPLLACEGTLTESESPVFQYDLSCGASHYIHDAVLIVDVGGDDVYSNNAGGGTEGVALLVDREGADRYQGQRASRSAVNGAGMSGIGVLVDGSGDDEYVASVTGPEARLGGTQWIGYGAVNGGADHGVGHLLDLAGNDTYNATLGLDGGANGGAERGAGLLDDRGGNDTYVARVGRYGGANGGGAFLGWGALLDAWGNDSYAANLGNASDSSTPGGGAANGGGADGIGLLVDGGGRDTYEASMRWGFGNGPSGGANGGGFLGSGTLIDRGREDDRYSANVTFGGVNGAALDGEALLFDEGGNDSYYGAVRFGGAANGAADLGAAALVDGGGNDRYEANILSRGVAHGSAYAGVGLLLDVSGEDEYLGALPPPTGARIVQLRSVEGADIDYNITLAYPSEQSKGHIIAEVRDVPNPCPALEPCRTAAEQAPDPRMRDWLLAPSHSATKSGGYKLVVDVPEEGVAGTNIQLLVIVAMVDDSCSWAC